MIIIFFFQVTLVPNVRSKWTNALLTRATMEANAWISSTILIVRVPSASLENSVKSTSTTAPAALVEMAEHVEIPLLDIRAIVFLGLLVSTQRYLICLNFLGSWTESLVFGGKMTHFGVAMTSTWKEYLNYEKELLEQSLALYPWIHVKVILYLKIFSLYRTFIFCLFLK